MRLVFRALTIKSYGVFPDFDPPPCVFALNLSIQTFTLNRKCIWRGVIAPFGQQMSLVGSGGTTQQHMLKKSAFRRGKREQWERFQ